MSSFKNSIVTENGKVLLFGNDKIIYTKAALFSQDLSSSSVEEIRSLTALTGNLFETPIGINKRGSGTVNIEAVFSNKGLNHDVNFNSVGWFAKPDGGNEVLVAVTLADSTQTLGAITPGQDETDAIDLVLAMAVGNASKVDVVIDPAGQVTAAKLNSIIENLKAKYDDQGDKLNKAIQDNKETISQTIDNSISKINSDIAANKTDIESKVKDLSSTVDNNKTSMDNSINSLSKTVTANKTDVDKKLATKANSADVDKALATKVDLSALGDYVKTADVKTDLNGKADVDMLGQYEKTASVDEKIAGVKSTINSNKTATDKEISSTNATVAANKKAADDALATKANASDVSKQISAVNATVSSNKSAADKSISDLNSTVTANKKDADSKISSLTTTVANNKIATDKAISDTNSTIAANKKSTDSAIATKANASDVYTRKQIDTAFSQRDSSISAKADKSTAYTKAEVDSKTASLQNSVNAKANKSDLNNLNGATTYKNPNFNNITASGTYYISSPTAANNAPTFSWGNLVVANGNGQRLEQLYFADNNVSYVRMYNANRKSWLAWKQLMTIDDYNNLQNQVNGKASSSSVTIAQNTANAAKTAATNAQNTANTANSTANSAKSTATSAQSTANSVNSKVNVGAPLFRRITNATSWQNIFGGANNTGYLVSLRDEAGGNTLGHFAAGVAFGGGDTKGVLTVSYNGNTARIAGGNGTAPVWHEDIAWKSDINNLQNQIKQIKDSVPVVRKFTDENQAKTWSNAGGSQVRIGLIED